MTLPISLPDVTVVAFDCAAHDLTRRAIEQTLKQITPKAVQIWTDKPGIFYDLGQTFEVSTVRSLQEAESILWYKVPGKIETSHLLTIEWDGWVLNGSLWNPEWLKYDWIGAPWPWHKTNRVGNGGFSLRSTRLMQFLANRESPFQIMMPTDDAICRIYRQTLEIFGFAWAPESEAEKFSIEHGDLRETFGFHDVRNWSRLLKPDKVESLVRLASPYVQNKPGFEEVRRAHG